MSPKDCAILLLDDESPILRLVTVVLNGAGYRNISAHTHIASAREAWHASGGKFDMVITDFCLADGAVTDFVHEIRSARQELPILVMTGFMQDSLDLEPSDSLMIIQKPFRPADLRAAVDARSQKLAA
jgi:DNA-binding response OmpR family regulator